MKTMNFKPRFGTGVITGAKRTSIRSGGYVSNQPIRLAVDGAVVNTAHVTMVQELYVDYAGYVAKVKVDGVTLSGKRMEQLARADGFADVDDLLDFVCRTYGLPFKGQLVTWVPAGQLKEAA